MSNTEIEIERVKTALDKTNSVHLRNDYEKYLKKLYRRLRSETHGKNGKA